MKHMVSLRRIVSCLAASAVVLGVCGVAAAREPAIAPPKIRTPHQYVYIVYFNPADKECWPDYQERLDRVMTEIQQWYSDEMERNGFGPMTFPLERDKDGTLVIHIVKGDRAYPDGKGASYSEIRENQVKPALLKEGIDIEQDHIIIFGNVGRIEDREGGAKAVLSWMPYCGTGDHKHGTAWVLDNELLDPLNLPKTEPEVLDGGTRSYTLGGWVVTYMGGTAHEFGHALGLPHNKETTEQRDALGIALMGSGNYHLFGERAGRDTGSFLSKAHATILSSHPLFRRDTTDIDVEPECEFSDLTFAKGRGTYTITGRVEATPRPYAVVAYNDPQGGSDYDASSWVSELDEDGRFEIHVGELEPRQYELRVRCYMVNGDKHQLSYGFTLDRALEIPVTSLNRQTVFELYAKRGMEAKDPDALLTAIEKLDDFNDIYYRRAVAAHRILTREPVEPQQLSALGDEVREVPLSSVAWASAEVGWTEPVCDSFEGRMPIESGEQIHERGLYAHADSRYVYTLGGAWKTFTGGYGLQNTGKGSVVFVVKCDGKEQFRSDLIDTWVEGRVEVDLTGVDTLELIVTDGGNGKDCDWGMWFSPMLKR